MTTTLGHTGYASIDTFLETLATGEGSPHTLASYRLDLVAFARWFVEHVPTEPHGTPESVTPTNVCAFRDWLVRAAKRKPPTFNRKLAGGSPR